MAGGEQPFQRILVCQSSADEELANRFLAYLERIVRPGGVDLWSEARIEPGGASVRKLHRALDEADLALLLVSPALLESPFLVDVDLSNLFTHRKPGRTHVIPVLLKTCQWKSHPWLGGLYALPKKGFPFARFQGQRQEQVIAEVVLELASMAPQKAPAQGGDAGPPSDAIEDREPPTLDVAELERLAAEAPAEPESKAKDGTALFLLNRDRGVVEDVRAHRAGRAQPESGRAESGRAASGRAPAPTPEVRPAAHAVDTLPPPPDPRSSSPGSFTDLRRPGSVPKLNAIMGMGALGTASPPPSESCVVVVWASDEKQRGNRYVIGAEGLSIGRDSENDIAINDMTVSGRHCRIDVLGSQVILRDLSSTNGTFVSDVGIEEQELAGGEQIWVGATILKYLTGSDITAQFHKIVSELATCDSVTGVFNARYMRDELDRLAARATQKREPLAMLALAVDHARELESSYGDVALEAVLVEIVRRLRAVLPSSSIIGRDGDAGFLVALPHGPTGAGGEVIAEAALTAVNGRDVFFQAYSIRTTISVGVAKLTECGSAANLVKLARERRYAAERAGGDRVVETAAALHRLQDAEWMLRKMVAMDASGAVAAFEIEDEISILGHLGRRARDEWFKELVEDVEHALLDSDMIATWQDRYVLAGLVNCREMEAEALVGQVRDRWTFRPVPAQAREAAGRALRTAILGPDELRGYREASLDQLLVRLVQRSPSEMSIEAANVARLPFPIAVTPAVVETRPTALARTRALLWGIEVVLRFTVAVELSALALFDDATLRRRLAETLRPYVGSRLTLEAWEALAFKLSALCLPAPLGYLSCVPRLLADVEAGRLLRSVVGDRIHGVIARAALRTDRFARSEEAHEHDEEEAELRATFDAMLGHLRPLGSCRLVNCDTMEMFEDEDDVFAYLLRELRGSSEHFVIKRETLPTKLLKECCYLMSPDRAPLSLAPLFFARVCSTCKRVEVFVADELKLGPPREKVLARGVTSDHAMELDLPKHRWMDELYRMVLAGGGRPPVGAR